LLEITLFIAKRRLSLDSILSNGLYSNSLVSPLEVAENTHSDLSIRPPQVRATTFISYICHIYS